MKALIAIAVATASAPLLAAAGDDATAAKSGNRMICRHVNTRTSETRMGNRRVCHTAEDWQRLQENGAPATDQSTMFHDLRPVITELGRSNRPN
jgi:hypothetical protein